jgi:hypothetical protein
MRGALISVVAVLLAACSTSGTSIKIGEGGTHPPTDPTSIALLLGPPQKPHEVIALVEGVAATDDYLTRARTEAAAIEAMKKEAARIGANAIVLTGKSSAPYGQVGYATTTGSAVATGNYISGYATTVSSGLGWEKITFSGTAIRYADADR